MLACDDLLAGKIASAEVPVLPSISSSPLHSSFVSGSKARIVIPSCEDRDGNGDFDEFEILEEESLAEISPSNDSNPRAFLSRKSFLDDQRGQESTSLGATPLVYRHQSHGEEIHNNALPRNGATNLPPPSKHMLKKTGTTIAGCVVPGGSSGPYVILAADTRATEDTIVADKQCDKIHKLASNCRCCGAGTSADLDKVTQQVLYHMAIQELQNESIGNGSINDDAEGAGSSRSVELLYPDHKETDDDGIEPLLWMRPVSIEVLCDMFQSILFRSGGQLGANLIVGGVWNREAYLRAIHPHGSTDVNLPFTALGSGGLAAMAVLEEGYRPSISIEEGIELVQRAILSGIRNDLGSGSQVDLCVIDPDGVCRQTRAVIPEEELLPDDSVKEPSIRTNRLLELLGKGDASNDEEINETQEDTTTKNNKSGVNGFGNQPFAIENTKQRMISIERDRAKEKEIWDKFLGI